MPPPLHVDATNTKYLWTWILSFGFLWRLHYIGMTDWVIGHWWLGSFKLGDLKPGELRLLEVDNQSSITHGNDCLHTNAIWRHPIPMSCLFSGPKNKCYSRTFKPNKSTIYTNWPILWPMLQNLQLKPQLPANRPWTSPIPLKHFEKWSSSVL